MNPPLPFSATVGSQYMFMTEIASPTNAHVTFIRCFRLDEGNILDACSLGNLPMNTRAIKQVCFAHVNNEISNLA